MLDYGCYVISLARQPDRFTAFLGRNRPTGLDFRKFDAIDGSALSDHDCVRLGLLQAGAQRYTKGQIGCGASHRALWQQTIDSRRNLLVFEDDAFCRQDLAAELERVVARLPQWELILLGYNTDAILDVRLAPNNNFYGFFSMPHQSARQLDAFADGAEQVTALRLNNAFGLCAYLVSPQGAQNLMAAFPMDNRPVVIPGNKPRFGRDTFACMTIDMLTNTLYRDMHAFALTPPLALPLNNPATSTTRLR